jgi:hypothetical protein
MLAAGSYAAGVLATDFAADGGGGIAIVQMFNAR